jgi:hypothetical protein
MPRSFAKYIRTIPGHVLLPYYDCFLKTIVYWAGLVAVFGPVIRSNSLSINAGKRNTMPVSCIDGCRLYRSAVVENINFVTRKEPGVQAADLWARKMYATNDARWLARKALYERAKKLVDRHWTASEGLAGKLGAKDWSTEISETGRREKHMDADEIREVLTRSGVSAMPPSLI